ncbi:MAG: hypothetical protein JO063_06185 [Pseudonocardiales bacterium]|nr:hypothetical protein [Pseudonocardiales bacterium]MBV9030923.1 hypothetical protein [Pseudonocardiales bacterium]MBW0009692.1 hypothetical protein [Pseudonocardiales bacterium]
MSQGVPGRWLVLTAGMGAGHDQVAGEMAGRIRARDGRVLVVDGTRPHSSEQRRTVRW